MSLLKLYGVPLSQPTRSVAWALLLNEIPFDFVLTVPGSSKAGIGARHEDFRNKTKARSITVPLLEDFGPPMAAAAAAGAVKTSPIAITESAAILIYLCESRRRGSSSSSSSSTSSNSTSWSNNLYGEPGTYYKATVDSYLHWHHTNTRKLGIIASSYLQPHMHKVENEQIEMEKIFRRLNMGWLQSSSDNDDDDNNNAFIAGPTPSIADLLCYEEIAQVYMTGVVKSLQNFPALQRWVERMQKLPYHDAVHVSLITLGDFTIPDAPQDPFSKRLSRATKAGILALNEAQKGFAAEAATPVSKL